MKRTNYITLMGWMFSDLGLKSNEALIYGLIYGFCQDGKSEFTGSLSYIQNTLNLSRNTVISCLKGLELKNHIVKRTIDERKHFTYNAYSLGSSISALGSAKNDNTLVQKLTEGSAKTAPNNTINNTISDSDNALAFLKDNSPARLETFLMQYKKRIDNWLKFCKDFNNKVVLEGLEYDVNKLMARLEIFAGNWIASTSKSNTDHPLLKAANIKWS